MPDPASGQRLDDDITLLRRIGRGGMADVWLARDRRHDEPIVVKLLAEDAEAESVRLLERESLAVRRLDHPNIIRVLDFHAGPGRAYVAMDHVDGGDAGRLRRRPPKQVLAGMLPIADALRHAHRRGVVHRDVKASNVLLAATERPFLVDFGIAAFGSAGDSVRGGGSAFAKSPQQLNGAPPDPADDVYGFGALLYDLISGHPPFWPNATADRVRSATLAALSSPHALPDGLADLIARMLAKSAAERPSMDGVISQLEELSGAERPQRAKDVEVRLVPPPRTEPVKPSHYTPSPSTRSVQRDAASGWPTFAGIAVLLAGVLVVLVLLPRWVARSPTVAASPATTGSTAVTIVNASPPVATVDPAARAAAALDRLQRLRGSVESRGVSAWGGARYARAVAATRRGDDLLGALDHAGAAAEYETAIGLLEQLDTDAAHVLAKALADGERALADGDSRAAEQSFELAATISPDHVQAQRGLRRATVLDDVLALVATARDAEEAGDLAGAATLYRQALAKDGATALARSGLDRVGARLADARYSRAMSEGLIALDEERWADARAALGRAATIRPGAAEIAEAVTRLALAEKTAAIAAHRATARALEQKEDWHRATASYEAVLKLDPAIAFALDGVARTRERARVADAIQFHIASPHRLQEAAVLEEAFSLLIEAEQLEPVGQRLRQQLTAFARLLAAAAQPVRVWLVSDDETEVTVFQVGRLGRFERRALDLRPGTYTVVGSRTGYRDVRRKLLVPPGESPAPFVVRCEEKL